MEQERAPAGALGTAEVADYEEMGLPDQLLRGVYSMGWERPSPIQRKAIVPAMTGRDIVMHAQSGTGKSGAFVIALLAQVDTAVAETQALVLSPTRDLAQQTADVATAVGEYMGAVVHLSIGGRSGREDAMALRRRPHVVCGTPGRVLGNLQRNLMAAHTIRTVVLDEMDVLLEEGFAEQMQAIFQQLPGDVQAMLVTATLEADVQAEADKLLRDPVKVLIPREQVTLEGIAQYHVDCGEEHFKRDVLCDLYSQLSVAQSVVFVNTQRRAVELAEHMEGEGFTVAVITGEMPQQDREAVVAAFKAGASRVLIATDVMARGIDAPSVQAVMNFDLPHDRANYIHRVGRCGRMGKRGVAINLVTQRDARQIQHLEEFYSTTIPPMPADFEKHIDRSSG